MCRYRPNLRRFGFCRTMTFELRRVACLVLSRYDAWVGIYCLYDAAHPVLFPWQQDTIISMPHGSPESDTKRVAEAELCATVWRVLAQVRPSFECDLSAGFV